MCGQDSVHTDSDDYLTRNVALNTHRRSVLLRALAENFPGLPKRITLNIENGYLLGQGGSHKMLQ